MQTSGDQRRENAKHIHVIGAQRAIHRDTYGADGSLRSTILAMTWRGGRQAAVSKGEATGRAHHLPGMEPGPRAPVTARPASISGSQISLW